MNYRTLTFAAMALLLSLHANAQTTAKKVYDESINPIEQIDAAISKAQSNGKYVCCQVGGNWCAWCLRFAEFIESDSTISTLVNANFEYIHVNYNPRKSAGAEKQEEAKQLMQRLNNAGRFGFPVIVILDENGNVIHIQDSSFLEEGKGYNKDKVIRFFNNWTPKATKG
jgi:thioredoxin-related protein